MNNEPPKLGRKGTNPDGTRGERFAGVFPADVAAWLRRQGNISAAIVRCIEEAMSREKAMESTLPAGTGDTKGGKVMTERENLISIRNGLVWIGDIGPLKRNNLQVRIQNIREWRHEYATDEAWLRTLQTSINALNMLDVTHKEAQIGKMESTLPPSPGNLPIGKDADDRSQTAGPADC